VRRVFHGCLSCNTNESYASMISLELLNSVAPAEFAQFVHALVFFFFFFFFE
jgi:hypothetical protein